MEIIQNTAKYTEPNNSAIMLKVILPGETEELDFVARETDVEPHGVAIFNAAEAGDYGPIAPYTPPTAEQVAASLHEYSAAKAHEAHHATWLLSPRETDPDHAAVTCTASSEFATNIALAKDEAVAKPNQKINGVDAASKSYRLVGKDVYVTGDQDLATPVTIYGQILKRRKSISDTEADAADGIDAGTITTYAGIDAAYS